MVYFTFPEGESSPIPMETYRTRNFPAPPLPLDLPITLSIRSMYLFGLTQIIQNSKYGIVLFCILAVCQ